MSNPEVLPDSRARHSRILGTRDGATIVPFFCMSCGVEMGRAPASDVMQGLYFLCEPQQNNCAARFGESIGLRKVQSPERIKFDKFAQAQLECFGRYATVDELAEVLDQVDHPLAKLARELFPQLR